MQVYANDLLPKWMIEGNMSGMRILISAGHACAGLALIMPRMHQCATGTSQDLKLLRYTPEENLVVARRACWSQTRRGSWHVSSLGLLAGAPLRRLLSDS